VDVLRSVFRPFVQQVPSGKINHDAGHPNP
jgi:hypothetical protein